MCGGWRGGGACKGGDGIFFGDIRTEIADHLFGIMMSTMNITSIFDKLLEERKTDVKEDSFVVFPSSSQNVIIL